MSSQETTWEGNSERLAKNLDSAIICSFQTFYSSLIVNCNQSEIEDCEFCIFAHLTNPTLA